MDTRRLAALVIGQDLIIQMLTTGFTVGERCILRCTEGIGDEGTSPLTT